MNLCFCQYSSFLFFFSHFQLAVSFFLYLQDLRLKDWTILLRLVWWVCSFLIFLALFIIFGEYWENTIDNSKPGCCKSFTDEFKLKESWCLMAKKWNKFFNIWHLIHISRFRRHLPRKNFGLNKNIKIY